MKEVENMEFYDILQEIYEEQYNIDDKPAYIDTIEKLLKIVGKIYFFYFLQCLHILFSTKLNFYSK